MNRHLEPYFIREEIIKTIRSYFYKHNFHEIIPSILNTTIPTEPNISPFTTVWNNRTSSQELFLSTSPERSIKRMMARGLTEVFAIGKCFRNLEGSGVLHMPEYSMLEWYRTGAQYETILEDLARLLTAVKKAIDAYAGQDYSPYMSYQGNSINLDDWTTLSLETLFEATLEVSYQQSCIDDEYFREEMVKRGYNVHDSTWHELFDQVFVQELEPLLPLGPCVLTDFPSRISPLCKRSIKKPHLAERFEFFLFRIEIANGNNEEFDTNASGMATWKDDGELSQALDQLQMYGKPIAGIGLGIDRLAMIFANVSSVHDVEPLSFV